MLNFINDMGGLAIVPEGFGTGKDGECYLTGPDHPDIASAFLVAGVKCWDSTVSQP